MQTRKDLINKLSKFSEKSETLRKSMGVNKTYAYKLESDNSSCNVTHPQSLENTEIKKQGLSKISDDYRKIKSPNYIETN